MKKFEQDLEKMSDSARDKLYTMLFNKVKAKVITEKLRLNHQFVLWVKKQFKKDIIDNKINKLKLMPEEVIDNALHNLHNSVKEVELELVTDNELVTSDELAINDVTNAMIKVKDLKQLDDEFIEVLSLALTKGKDFLNDEKLKLNDYIKVTELIGDTYSKVFSKNIINIQQNNLSTESLESKDSELLSFKTRLTK